MSIGSHRRCLCTQLWTGDKAAQLVEFAVTLPLLVVFVVGIFDFSGAYTLKQKLTAIARDAARTAASEPITDLAVSPRPASVYNAFWVVDGYLTANQINDCGVLVTSGTLSPPPATWTYTATAPGCNLTLIINRGYLFPATAAAQPVDSNCAVQQSAAGQTAVIATCVSIQYGYQWRFGKVASLLGSTPILPSSITATAVAMNEN